MAYKRILCAVDFSRQSNAAFLQAVDLAEKYSSRLFLLHAIEVQPLVSQWMAPDGLSDITIRVEEKAKEAMEELQNTIATRLQQIQVHTEITSGRAFTEILENARVWSADLIVLGETGGGSLEDMVLGSTAHRVLTEASCSVLIVRSGAEAD